MIICDRHSPLLDTVYEDDGKPFARGRFFGGGGPSGNTTTVQKSDPWSGQQPYLSFGMQQAQNLYNTGGPQYYPGTTYAPATQAQNTAIANQIGVAGNDPLTNPALNFATNSLGGNYLNSNPENAALTPYTSGAMLSAQNPYFQNMAQSVAAATEPGLAGQFTQGNRMNSPGAAYGVTSGVANAIGNLGYQNYQEGQQNQLAALGQVGQNYNTATGRQEQSLALAPYTQQLPYTDTSQMYNAGAQQQQLSQNVINDALTRYNYQQTEPYNLLNFFNQSIAGNYGGTTNLTQPYFQQQTGGWGGALSGAGSGAAIGSVAGPYGMAAGAIIGALAGGLS